MLVDEIKEKPPKKRQNRNLHKIVTEILATLFWLYVPIKVFVYDIDVIFLRLIGPGYRSVYDYRFFLFVTVFLAYWCTFRSGATLRLIAYVLAYPLVISFRISKRLIPRLSSTLRALPDNMRSMLAGLLIGYLSNIRSFFRLRVFLAWATVLAVLGIYFTNDRFLLITAVIYLVAFLFAYYILRVLAALNSVGLDLDISRLDIDNFLSPSPKLAKKYQADPKRKQRDQIFRYYLLLRFRKLVDDFSRAHHLVLYYIGAVLHTLLLTIVLLGFAHSGLYKIQPSEYTVLANPSFMSFVHLATNSVLSLDTTLIVPIGVAAHWLFTIGAFIGYLMALIYITVFLGILITRQNQTLGKLLKDTELVANRIVNLIEEEHGKHPDQLVAELSATDQEAHKEFETAKKFLGAVFPLPDPPE